MPMTGEELNAAAVTERALLGNRGYSLQTGLRYVLVWRVDGPAPRALPVIPLKAKGANLVGGMTNPAWYIYC